MFVNGHPLLQKHRQTIGDHARIRLQQGSVVAHFQPFDQRLQSGAQKYDFSVYLEKLVVFPLEHQAAARGNNKVVLFRKLFDDIRLQPAEILLPVILENIGNIAVAIDDHLIGVVPAPPRQFGDFYADGRFARAHHAAKNDIHFISPCSAARLSPSIAAR